MLVPRVTYDPTDAVDVVARTLWGEARGEGRAGMEAVAAVIANRVRNPRWWGHGWLSVCRRPYQFSCWNPDDPNAAKVVAVDGSDPAFVTATLVAEHVVNGELPDPTGGADSYFALGTPEPAWASKATHTVTIGRHAFYCVELQPSPMGGFPDAPEAAAESTADNLNAAELAAIPKDNT